MSALQDVLLRPPTLEDGMDVFALIDACPPLDTNSSYCNLLQCGHFSSTSVAAEANGEVVGFISGYLQPEQPQVLFIWQVAVASKARGLGLASRMLENILSRPACRDVQYLETTITRDNQASWSLFERLAAKRSTQIESSEWLDQQQHFKGQHPSELLVRIGPLTNKETS